MENKRKIVIQFEVNKSQWEKMREYILKNSIPFYVLRRFEDVVENGKL